jgi:poly(hydroxyalkanoate) depolymerase family esterase
MKLNEDFLAQMREATSLLQSGGPAAATAAIQRALGIHGAHADEDSAAKTFVDLNTIASQQKDPAGAPAPQRLAQRLRAWSKARGAATARDVEDAEVKEAPAAGAGAPGRFLSGSFSNRAGTRAYRLYVPSHANGEPLPLVVMLHGCKQNPDDFAAGTGMNRLAEELRCIVLYPAQNQRDNGSNCWNWFNPSDQRREHGEPSILAGMTQKIMSEYPIDPDRVYVAGLSAGGAMASVLAAGYPDLYAAVAIHSGLPVGCAQDVASAFGAMKGGSHKHIQPYRHTVPAIVFHGDRDHTVHPDNGVAALAQSMGMSVETWRAQTGKGQSRVNKGKKASGRSYTQTVFEGNDGQPHAEHWLIHGAAHAWSGGSAAGSYTDPKGPDASAEMMRFFRDHPRKARSS